MFRRFVSGMLMTTEDGSCRCLQDGRQRKRNAARATEPQYRMVGDSACHDIITSMHAICFSLAILSGVTAFGQATRVERKEFETRRKPEAATALAIGENCSTATPCVARFGNHVYSFVRAATATLSGGSGTVWIYVSSSGQLTVGGNITLKQGAAAGNVACSPECVARNGVTGFPHDSIPLFIWEAENGSWRASGSDQRAWLSSKNISAGLGLMAEDGPSGATGLRIDATQVGMRAQVPESATSVCSAGQWAINELYYYVCVKTNTWRRAELKPW